MPAVAVKPCLTCKNAVGAKVCSRCSVAHYCSKECQAKAFPVHKSSCSKIKKLREKVASEEIPLRNSTEDTMFDTDASENLFETGVGHFWSLFTTRDYCRARYALGMELVKAGQKEENVIAMEAGLDECLELLRLIHGDNMGLRNVVPFFLIGLNRVQDCYDFIKWWATIDPHGKYDWGRPPKLEKGEWGYLRDQDMTEDLFEDPRVGKPKSFDADHLFALVIMKILVIRKLKGEGAGADAIEKQEELLKKYSKFMQDVNKWVLKGVVNPDKYLAMDPPMYISPGGESQAQGIVVASHYVVQKLGLKEKIKELLEA